MVVGTSSWDSYFAVSSRGFELISPELTELFSERCVVSSGLGVYIRWMCSVVVLVGRICLLASLDRRRSGFFWRLRWGIQILISWFDRSHFGSRLLSYLLSFHLLRTKAGFILSLPSQFRRGGLIVIFSGFFSLILGTPDLLWAILIFILCFRLHFERRERKLRLFGFFALDLLCLNFMRAIFLLVLWLTLKYERGRLVVIFLGIFALDFSRLKFFRTVFLLVLWLTL